MLRWSVYLLGFLFAMAPQQEGLLAKDTLASASRKHEGCQAAVHGGTQKSP